MTIELAVAMRNAANADQKEWKKFLEAFSNEDPEVAEAKKVEESAKALERLFGGGKR